MIDEQKKFVEKIKKCQRNWQDIDIPKEHIDHFIWMATNSPSKQYEAYFNIYVVTNKQILKDLLEHTWGFTLPIDEGYTQEIPCCVRNPQLGASAYILWTRKNPDTNRNFYRTGENKANDAQPRRDNAFTSIGISMALVSFSAASLGYETAYNKNHDKPGKPEYWQKTLGILENEEITFGLGIGRGKDGYSHNESDEHRLMVGWPDWEIIDIKETRSYEYKGETYSVLDKITYPSFSSQPRNINVTRIE